MSQQSRTKDGIGSGTNLAALLAEECRLRGLDLGDEIAVLTVLEHFAVDQVLSPAWLETCLDQARELLATDPCCREILA